MKYGTFRKIRYIPDHLVGETMFTIVEEKCNDSFSHAFGVEQYQDYIRGDAVIDLDCTAREARAVIDRFDLESGIMLAGKNEANCDDAEAESFAVMATKTGCKLVVSYQGNPCEEPTQEDFHERVTHDF